MTDGRHAVSRAKVAAPRLPARHVPRPRLVAALDAAASSDDAVVLLSAPAGYGKTLLLAEWAAAHPGRTAWVSIDGDDRDDRRFWSAVLAALTSCAAVPADSGLHRLAVPDAPSRDPGFLAAVVNAVDAAVTTPLTLVLDDVHELAGAPLRGVATLVRDRPARLLLVLSSRFDPPVRLDRLRLDGRLCELRAADLAFTRDEARTLLAAADVALDVDQLGVLLTETEGWAAGLRLAALTLHDAGDPGPLLVDLVRTGHAVSDYLVGEILSRLPGEVVDVLTAVSLCDAVTVPLAVAITRRDDAGALLVRVKDETGLVTSYGRGRRWFRVHQMLRAQLRADLQRRRPDLAAAIHGRAARALAATGDAAPALDHALQADDPPLLAELLTAHGPRLATSGHHDAVCRAAEALPVEWLRREPALALALALAHLEAGQVATADRFLADAEAAWPGQPGAALVATRDTARARRAFYGPVTAPLAHGSTTGDDDAVALLLRATAAVADGDLQGAVRLGRAVVDRATSAGDDYLAARAQIMLAAHHGLLGDVATMVDLARRGEARAPEHGWRGSVGHALGQMLLGYGALAQGRAADALAVLDAFDDVVEAHGNRAEIHHALPLLDTFRLAARFDLGERPAAVHALREARLRSPQSWALDRPTNACMALVEHDAALRLGRRDHAREVLAWAEEHVGPTGDVLLLRAAGPAAISRHALARQHLRPLLDGTAAPLVPWTLQAGWVLEATLLLHTAGRGRAREAMAAALAGAAATGVLRPLVAAPDEQVALMVEHRGEGAEVARAVLALRRARPAAGAGTPLTDRERAVLDLLPTVLSLDEIAATLAVSVNTVKTHLRALYAKVGAHPRRAAVPAARGAGRRGPGPADGG